MELWCRPNLERGYIDVKLMACQIYLKKTKNEKLLYNQPSCLSSCVTSRSTFREEIADIPGRSPAFDQIEVMTPKMIDMASQRTLSCSHEPPAHR
jgi:hypothetical protein